MPLRPPMSSFWKRFLLYLHLGFCALACCGYAEAPETFAQALKRLHIEVTQTVLTQALCRSSERGSGARCSSARRDEGHRCASADRPRRSG
jgi:hypothetical protein